jgi:hypothetical protein
MPVKTTCPHCRRSYNMADSMSGKMVKCKDCGAPFRVDVAGAVADAVPVPDDRRERDFDRDQDRDRDRDRRNDDDRPRRRYDDDDDWDRRPRRKSRTGLWVGLGVGGGVLLILGVILIVLLARGSGRINNENYERIKHNMTEDEVTAILGAGSDTETPGPPFVVFGIGTVRVWREGGNHIKVLLLNGRVAGKACKIGIMEKHQQGF